MEEYYFHCFQELSRILQQLQFFTNIYLSRYGISFFMIVLILTAAILYNLSVYDDEQESCFWQTFGLAQTIAGVLLPTLDKTGGRYGIMLQRIIEGIATVIGITTAATIPNDTLPAYIKKYNFV